MYVNERYDKVQYKNYLEVFGELKELKTFAKFQDLKYNNLNEYKLMKGYYKIYATKQVPFDLTYDTYINNVTNKDWKAVGFNPKYIQSHIKHLKEFNNITWEEYERRAKELLNSSSKDIERFISKEGTRFAYNKNTNEFAIARKNGITQTYFLPKRKYEYWKEQIEKYGEENS